MKTVINTGENGYIIRKVSHGEVYFPEITTGLNGPYPVSIAGQIADCPGMVGKTILTLSEVVILWFLSEVGAGRISPDDLAINYFTEDGEHRTIRVDETGELIDRWPGGFFDWRVPLLFGDED